MRPRVRRARKLPSALLSEHTHPAAPQGCKVGQRLRVPWEGTWTVHEVRQDARGELVVCIDPDLRRRFLRVAPTLRPGSEAHTPHK